MSFIDDEQMACLEEVIANITRQTHIRVIEVTDMAVHYEWARGVGSKAIWNTRSIKKDDLALGMKRLEMEINVARGLL